ncbi:MAG: TonB-dependent receptor [Betaproteobacteria bacterium]|nr:TonB-dependent receptor [Betaproteobacteria bacterium]
MAAPLAFAQQAAPKTEKVEKIEITGTRLPAPNLEGPSPVSVITAEDIKIDGTMNVENLLNSMPQVFADQNSTVSNGASGTATVNLRGLGTNRTLVLMNGRRMPLGDTTTVAPDLNQIPAALIKRVEILTGGAGAVYGSDAVAGVVNFIMNDKFQGVQIDANQSWNSHQQDNPKGVADIINGRAATNPAEFQVPGNKSSDGRIGDLAITMGSNFADGKGNGTVFFGYHNADALLQSERDFSACALAASGSSFSCGGSGTSATGRVTNLADGRVWTNDRTTNATRRYNNSLDQYNFGPTNYYQRPDERYTAAAYANYDITPQAKIYAEFNFMDDRSIGQVAPGGIFGNIATIYGDNPLLSAGWRSALGLNSATDSTDVVVQRRNVEGGGRQSDYRHTSYREVLGVKGDIGKWSYDVYMEAAKVIVSQTQQNYFMDDRINRALDVVNVNGQAVCRTAANGTDPNCVPYNVWSNGAVTPAMLSYLQAPGIQTGGTQQAFYGGTLTADLGDYGWKLPQAQSGVGVALGAERRTEKVDLLPDGNVATGNLSGSGGPTPPLDGKYTVNEYFGEMRLPILDGVKGAESLSASGSIRHSSYSTGNSTNTWGLGLDWAPVKTARLRGSYQSAVRAPNLVELYQAQGNNLFDMDSDPCAGPTPTATRVECARTGVTAAQYGTIQDSPAGQYNFLQGGNPELKPEEAKTYTIGFVWTPMRNFSATVDYYDIKIDRTISIVSPTTTLSQCLSNGAFCDLIHRDTLGTLWLLNDGRITATNQNLGGTETSGIDVGFNYSYRMTNGYGSLGLNMIGTWLQKLETEEIKGLGKYDCVGLYGANKCGSPNPEWRHKMRGTWTTPWNWDLALTWRYLGEVEVQETSSNPLLAGGYNEIEKTLSSQNYIDIAGSWNVTKQFTLRGGINNMLDRDPPLTSQQGPSVFGNGNTFPGTYDSFGRHWFVNATYKF